MKLVCYLIHVYLPHKSVPIMCVGVLFLFCFVFSERLVTFSNLSAVFTCTYSQKKKKKEKENG